MDASTSRPFLAALPRASSTNLAAMRVSAEFQLIQAMLADSQAELLAGWALVKDVAHRFDGKPAHASDPDISMRVSCAKLFATEMVGRVADRGVQVHGGAGYINEYPVERFYRDARLLRLYEGTTQVQQLIIGRELLRAD